ncbi:Alpha-ketoglutarate dependent xanthine dioxygenase [Colletotrichum higginsianum IMI 349063]|uniref:Alpha-ketoglutarate dependent xanthine dioxygenase n=2 Tax=Colletotrichum higginsianum (strain IMI 349063) TaxID=759273 RepID=A0A1B7XXU8_COLHI|nr:Alpha-ketoglutarate dependent xanthine dioxygenase [Colletotrichum higginsianum IMI 349063]OBR04597.1 Alpha-ketoglutarate dependent xanthine dioxygenase [Colletotrichum higginsianum IMI 349063]
MGSMPGFKIQPFKNGLKFGAEVHGLDINNMTGKSKFSAAVRMSDSHEQLDADVENLRETIQKYFVVVVKNQQNELPSKNWELLQKLDPGAPEFTDEEWAKFYNPEGKGILLGYNAIPNAGRLYLMGKGYQGKDHYGLKNVEINEAFADAYYSKPLPLEDFKKGVARFQSWHMDGPQYNINPPKFSSFRSIRVPQGEQTVEWADGSGMTMKIKPGRTAFISTAQMYDVLSEDEKRMADHSWCEYMYYPYEWILGCRGNPNGLNVACEGREVPEEVMESMPRDPKHQQILPMVWVNDATGGKHFQVQPNIVRRLFIRSGPDEKPRVIDDIKEVRDFLTNIQGRILRPENVYVGPEDEGDHLFWYNWGVMHSKIDYPVEFGVRTAHQGWLPGSKAPKGPVPIPGR